MQLIKLKLQNFRCFKQRELALDAPVILIEGDNGSGKTSVLEALHYICYLRSFRTHLPRELVHFDTDNFFIQAEFYEGDESKSELAVGFHNKKRSVKLNKSAVGSYKELIDHFRVITLSEDDLGLIKGAPDGRRSYIDQFIFLHEPDILSKLRVYRNILSNRNALLQKKSSQDMYQLWTEQLWDKTVEIQRMRIEHLAMLEKEMANLCEEFFGSEHTIALQYHPKKKIHKTLASFLEEYPDLHSDEHRMYRSLFGAHLDDFTILFQHKKSKAYASRGQQKLLALLLKVAQIKILGKTKGPCIFLLDDFMTDFDAKRLEVFIKLLRSLDCQLIFTSPVHDSNLSHFLKDSCHTISM
ncbi:MAG TPA: DNA replication and repair protein RecF [Candidatus Babeliales bacterium]|nr:DNA replication and repair protein RecF [Candidatus Babeliales bacterium]